MARWPLCARRESLSCGYEQFLQRRNEKGTVTLPRQKDGLDISTSETNLEVPSWGTGSQLPDRAAAESLGPLALKFVFLYV